MSKKHLLSWEDVVAERPLPPAAEARLRRKMAEVRREHDLRSIRELAGKTQIQVSEATTMTQSEVSRLERRTDHKLSTLQRYVEALGGSLEVYAVFGNKSVRVRSAETTEKTTRARRATAKKRAAKVPRRAVAG